MVHKIQRAFLFSCSRSNRLLTSMWGFFGAEFWLIDGSQLLSPLLFPRFPSLKNLSLGAEVAEPLRRCLVSHGRYPSHSQKPPPSAPKKERKQLWWEQSTANLRGKHKIRFFSANFFSFFDFVKICLFCCFFCFFFACFLSLSVWEFWWNFFWHKIYQILAPLFPCKVINKETVEWGLCNLLAKNTERGKNTKPLPAIQGNKDLVNNILPRLWLWSNGCFWVVALSLSGWYWSQPPPQR